MRLPKRRLSFDWAAWEGGLVLLALTIAGCTRTQSADQALAKAYEATGGQREEVAKVAGTVTIDGQPVGDTGPMRTIVILYDPHKPDASRKAPLYAVCDEDGHFEFTRYSKGDGVPPGSYTVLFEELVARTGSRFTGEDQLKNLYNDPDKSPFHVDISPPGKTDWMFNLEIAGKDPATPGPHAVKQLHR